MRIKIQSIYGMCIYKYIYIYKHIYTVYNKYIVLNEFKQKYDVKAIEEYRN